MSVLLLSTLGGLQPPTQQLSHAYAPIGGVPGTSRVPHLQIQEVDIVVMVLMIENNPNIFLLTHYPLLMILDELNLVQSVTVIFDKRL